MTDERDATSTASLPLERACSRALELWCALDHESVFLPHDHEAIEATRPLRALVVDLLVREPEPTARDLLHGLAALGRITAEQSGSPTLAVSTIDRLVAALDGSRSRPSHPDLMLFTVWARAAVVESFVHAASTALREDGARAWDYPRCVVTLRKGVVAVAAGHPTDDAESLAAWASRVAHALSLSGVRRAVVSGSEMAVLALEEALDLAGVARLDGHASLDEADRSALHRTGQ